MAKIKLDAATDGETERQAVLDDILSSRGYVSNILRTLTLSPEASKRFSLLGAYTKYESNLTSIERELAISATAHAVPYGWAHHAPLAIIAGATEDQMAALKDGVVTPDLDPAHQALCRFALAIAQANGVSQDVLDEVQRHYAPDQVIDIAMTSAYFMAIGALVKAFDIEIEDDAVFEKEQAWEERKQRAQSAT